MHHAPLGKGTYKERNLPSERGAKKFRWSPSTFFRAIENRDSSTRANPVATATNKMKLWSRQSLSVFRRCCFGHYQTITMDICSSDVPCNSSSGIVNRFLFKPPAPCVYCFPNDLFRLQTSRGNRIYTTYIERPGATIHLLVSHGNAEDLNMCYGFMRKMSILLNVNVVGYDYSGYGCSTGKWQGCRCRMA